VDEDSYHDAPQCFCDIMGSPHTDSLAFVLYLVNKLPPEWVVFLQNICPELRVLPAHQIASLTLKQ